MLWRGDCYCSEPHPTTKIMKFFFTSLLLIHSLYTQCLMEGYEGGEDNIEFHSTPKNEQFSSLIVRKSGDKISFVDDDL